MTNQETPKVSEDKGGSNAPNVSAELAELKQENEDLKKLNTSLQGDKTKLEEAVNRLTIELNEVKEAAPAVVEPQDDIEIQYGEIVSSDLGTDNARLRIQWRPVSRELWQTSSWGPGNVPSIEDAQAEIRDAARVLT